MRSIPGMVVMSPADDVEARAMVKAAYEYVGPVYMRFGRASVPVIHQEENFSFQIGKGEVLMDGSDVAIIATGLLSYEALEAGKALSGPDLLLCGHHSGSGGGGGHFSAACREENRFSTPRQFLNPGCTGLSSPAGHHLRRDGGGFDRGEAAGGAGLPLLRSPLPKPDGGGRRIGVGHGALPARPDWQGFLLTRNTWPIPPGGNLGGPVWCPMACRAP